MSDLDRLEKLAREATPGPWEADGLEGNLDSGDIRVAEVAMWREADAEFIAAVNPQAILELIERVRQAEDRIAELEKSYRIIERLYKIERQERIEAEARIAEAAKLHRKYTYYELEDSCPDTSDEHREEHHHESEEIGEFYCDQMPTGDVTCDNCRDVNGDRMEWPCPTALALGLNEGENE